MSRDIFASALAAAGDIEQAHFFNQFAASLKQFCKGREDNQLCYMADHLDSNARWFFKDLSEFVALNDENRPKAEIRLSELRSQQWELEKQITALQERKLEMEK